jgi:hypothetical protein
MSLLQEDPASLAVLPPDVLVRVLRQLPLSVRLLECSLVCRTWLAAAAVATDDLQLLPPTGSCTACAIQSWMVQHGSNLKEITLSRASSSDHWLEGWGPQEVQLPFRQLSSLTKLWATNADLLDLPIATDPDGAAGSNSSSTVSTSRSSTTTSSSSSSSSGSDNPLSALTRLAELGLSRSCVLGAPGALQFLPALGASLTRLRLACVPSK